MNSICKQLFGVIFAAFAALCIFSNGALAGEVANLKPSDDTRWGINNLLPPLSEMTLAQRMLARTVPTVKIDSDTGIDKLVVFPTGAGNAAEFYAQLEKTFTADRLSPDGIELNPKGAGVAAIFKAVMIRDCRFTPQFYPALTSGDVKQPDVIVFFAYLRALFARALELEQQQNIAGADTIYRCCLIFGWHLTQAPESLLVESLGVRIKYLATREYAQFLQRQLDPRDKIARQYEDYLEHTQGAFDRKIAFFLGNTLAFNSLYCAIRIGTEDADPAWRREAILRLGVFRHGATGSDGKVISTDPAKQKDAESALTYIAEKDPDETNRQLAVWVINKLTPELFLNFAAVKSIATPEKK